MTTTLQHPLSAIVPEVLPGELCCACNAARPVVAVLMHVDTVHPMLLCGHHARKHWAVLSSQAFTYHILDTNYQP